MVTLGFRVSGFGTTVALLLLEERRSLHEQTKTVFRKSLLTNHCLVWQVIGKFNLFTSPFSLLHPHQVRLLAPRRSHSKRDVLESIILLRYHTTVRSAILFYIFSFHTPLASDSSCISTAIGITAADRTISITERQW